MPTGLNSTELDVIAPSWVSEPNGRGLLKASLIRRFLGFCTYTSAGTWKIIYSCCFTLSLCVYTAIHLNVGPAGESTYQWWRRKSKWVVIAILSPEIMLYTAGKQWFSASRLCKKLNKRASEELEQTLLPKSNLQPFWSRSDTPVKAVRAYVQIEHNLGI